MIVLGSCQAQFFNASHVPKESKIILSDLHPKLGSNVTWTKEPEGYQASFLIHNKAHYVLFDFQGNYVAEASTITKRALPKKVRKHLREAYRTFRIEQSVVIVSSSGDLVYETTLASKTEEYKLIFSDSGYVLEVLPLPAILTE